MSKETFKKFIRNKPELINYINDGTMTWQKFYELYDLYGENNEVWKQYQTKKELKVTELLDKFKPEVLQKHLENASKVLDIFSEFATKSENNINNQEYQEEEELQNTNNDEQIPQPQNESQHLSDPDDNKHSVNESLDNEDQNESDL